MKEYSYPAMTRTQVRGTEKFILHIEEGQFTDSEILVLLGENGTTTFCLYMKSSLFPRCFGCCEAMQFGRFFRVTHFTPSINPPLRTNWEFL
jgi:hypothetical protein